MHRLKNILLLILILLGGGKLFAQSPQLRYADAVYNTDIKTILCYNDGNEQSFPMYTLNSDGKLFISFDDISGNVKNFFYAIEPCTPDWKPANLQPLEYQNGYSEDRISNSTFSYTTRQRYVHYEFSFPNENMQPTISGNFILKVYEDNDPSKLAFTRRFLVLETGLTVSAVLVRSPIVDDRDTKQKINFTITIPDGYRVDNPFNDIKAVVMQNERWDYAQMNTKPLFVRENKLIYEQNEANIFDAGNEFRKFDLRSFRFLAEHIGKITSDSLNEVLLVSDLTTTFDRYVFLNDFNGKYYVRVNEFNNSNIQADYAWVNFSLPYDPVLTNGNLYVNGKFADWDTTAATKMRYDYAAHMYRARVYLKQGVYDYQYNFWEKGSKSPDIGLTEGARFETENRYTVLVYHRPTGSRYFHLVAYTQLNSNPAVQKF